MIRRNLLTNEPIVFAPSRASRPHAFSGDATEIVCPFCPGNEHETPPELARIGDPWRVRVFPNKYPSVDDAEVIVESSEHDASFDSIAHAEDVVATYLERYRAHASAEYVAVFKNEGERAGASIPHVHSQVMPLDFTPPRIAREAEAFRDDHCPLCDDAAGEVIGESESFAWLAPYGSSMPYQQWLVPREHHNEMSGAAAGELAAWLQRSAAKMRELAPAFNWAFVNFPRHQRAHWYVDLFPRLTAIAGFELGTGTFVEIIDPAAAARHFGS
ncbi:MAG TPA: DUF4931 domain-containing protein [Thermoanaerobaculia bacterium]